MESWDHILNLIYPKSLQLSVLFYKCWVCRYHISQFLEISLLLLVLFSGELWLDGSSQWRHSRSPSFFLPSPSVTSCSRSELQTVLSRNLFPAFPPNFVFRSNHLSWEILFFLFNIAEGWKSWSAPMLLSLVLITILSLHPQVIYLDFEAGSIFFPVVL